MSLSTAAKKKAMIAGAAVLVLGGGVWGTLALTNGKKSSLPSDLQKAIKAGADDPGKLMEQVRAAVDTGKLTEEQRHELFRSVHDAMEKQMDKRLDEYFVAAPANRTAILDRHIDEMQARMKEWEQRRAQGAPEPRDGTAGGSGDRPRRSEQAGASGGSAGGPPSAGGGPGGGGFRGDRHGPPSREQRKERFESRDPDSRARRMAYFSALQARAQQRGIQLSGPMMGPGGRNR